MKLKDKVKPSVPPMDGGVYMAVCVLIADLGDQYSEKFKNTSRKVVFTFEIPSETVEVDGEQKPRQLSKRVSFSVGKKGNMRKMINSWQNKNYDEIQLMELDLFSLLGQPCQIRVTVSEDGAHNNVDDVLALPKGMPKPVTQTPLIAYDMDEHGFAGDVWDGLPEWVRRTVEGSVQYQKDAPDKLLDMPPEEDATEDVGEDEQEEACPI